MCRNCGAIVGAGEDKCAVCGALVETSQSQQPRLPADRETMRFARIVLSRPYKFTIIFLIINFFLFLMMWESSGMSSRALWEIPENVLIAYGAKVNSLINDKHQWWRFVTPIFIHVNLPHVLVNMYSLWMVGPYVEKLYGPAKFVVFWVVTGVVGVTASYLTVVTDGAELGSLGRFLFKIRDVPSAGASGALFGLVGVLFVFGIKFRHELPEGFKRAFGTGMLPIIFINLFIGYVGRGFIDNAAHLGGLISGAALAVVVQYRRPGERTSVTASWYVLQTAAMLLVLVSFFKVVQHFKDPTGLLSAKPTTVFERRDKFLLYSLALHEAQEKLNQAVKGDITGVDEALKSLDSVPQLDARADELREQLKDLLRRAKSEAEAADYGKRKAGIATQGNREPALANDPAQSKPDALIEDVDLWKKVYNDWLKTTARHY